MNVKSLKLQLLKIREGLKGRPQYRIRTREELESVPFHEWRYWEMIEHDGTYDADEYIKALNDELLRLGDDPDESLEDMEARYRKEGIDIDKIATDYLRENGLI